MAGQGLASFVLGAVEGDFESGEKSTWSAAAAGLNYRRAACKVGQLLLSFVRKIELHRFNLALLFPLMRGKSGPLTGGTSVRKICPCPPGKLESGESSQRAKEHARHEFHSSLVAAAFGSRMGRPDGRLPWRWAVFRGERPDGNARVLQGARHRPAWLFRAVAARALQSGSCPASGHDCVPVHW